MITDDIFAALQKIDNCVYIDKKELADKKFLAFQKIILINTEISYNNTVVDLILYVCLGENLKVELPKIFIEKSSYEYFKHVPHINYDLSICVIDESINLYYDIKDLPKIVLSLVSRAKRIIQLKDDKIYTDNEFNLEFQAYWSISYDKTDKPIEEGLTLIDENVDKEIEALQIEGIGRYKYLIHNNSPLATKFLKYLKDVKIQYRFISVFKINYKNHIPPFNLSYAESKVYLNDTIIKQKFNKLRSNEFLVIFENTHKEYFGWKYSDLNNLHGFRKQSNWEKLDNPIMKNKNVLRISFSEITPNRLIKRTDGVVREDFISLSIVGLGSVGSHFLQFLSKLNISEINLVDPDELKIENVFRHSYGFKYIHEFKTRIAEYHLINKNPFLTINTYEEKLEKLLKRKPNFFNDADFNFLITANTKLEIYVLEYLEELESSKPLFLIWIEPYMASGQIMYILPKDFKKARELLISFPYHALKNKGNEDLLFLKEGSCQSGYSPYSEQYLTLFSSAGFNHIYNIISIKKPQRSNVFSWYGDVDFLNNVGLNINIDKSKSFKIEINEF